jgi:hypothetical protein
VFCTFISFFLLLLNYSNSDYGYYIVPLHYLLVVINEGFFVCIFLYIESFVNDGMPYFSRILIILCIIVLFFLFFVPTLQLVK